MAEKEKRLFTHKELAELLVKHAGIREGHWGLLVEFGLAAANMPIAGPDGGFALKPTAIIPVNSIGILRFDESTPLTVDAAAVNPRAAVPKERVRTKRAQSP